MNLHDQMIKGLFFFQHAIFPSSASCVFFRNSHFFFFWTKLIFMGCFSKHFYCDFFPQIIPLFSGDAISFPHGRFKMYLFSWICFFLKKNKKKSIYFTCNYFTHFHHFFLRFSNVFFFSLQMINFFSPPHIIGPDSSVIFAWSFSTLISSWNDFFQIYLCLRLYFFLKNVFNSRAIFPPLSRFLSSCDFAKGLL